MNDGPDRRGGALIQTNHIRPAEFGILGGWMTVRWRRMLLRETDPPGV
jgi:hypothetical protein